MFVFYRRHFYVFLWEHAILCYSRSILLYYDLLYLAAGMGEWIIDELMLSHRNFVMVTIRNNQSLDFPPEAKILAGFGFFWLS